MVIIRIKRTTTIVLFHCCSDPASAAPQPEEPAAGAGGEGGECSPRHPGDARAGVPAFPDHHQGQDPRDGGARHEGDHDGPDQTVVH